MRGDNYKSNKNSRIHHVILLGLVAAVYSSVILCIFINYVNFPNEPLGIDSIPHSAKVSLLNFWGFEGFKWLPSYYFGSPHFAVYPPASYFLLSSSSSIGKISPEHIIRVFNWAGYISIILTFVTIMILIYAKSHPKVGAALIAASYFGASPGIFEPWIWGGNYAELLTLSSIPIGLLFLDRYLEKRKLKYGLLYLVMGIYSIVGHEAVGFFFIITSIYWSLIEGEYTYRLGRVFLLLIALSGLTAWYLIPLVYLRSAFLPSEGIKWQTLSYSFRLNDYINTFIGIETGLPPSEEPYRLIKLNLMPLITAITICIIMGKRRKGKSLFKLFLMILPSISLISYFILCVSFHIPYPVGFPPYRLSTYIVIISSITLGLLFSLVQTKHGQIIVAVTMLIGTSLLLLSPNFSFVSERILKEEDKNVLSLVANLSLSSYEYRIGGVRDVLFYWLHLYHPSVYTSRGYYGVIPYIHWQSWYEHALAGAPVTLFWRNNILQLLDWSATKYVGLKKEDTGAVLLSSSFLKPIADFLNLTVYEFSDSPPISEVLLKGGVLFFGDYEGYDTVLRSIASSSYTKPAPVIVWAEGKCIDDVSSDVLEGFSSIILYRYCYRDREKAFNLLRDYVYKGGRLFIETMSSTDESSNMPPPIPVAKTYRGEVSGSWTLEIREHILTANITENMFSPPVYDGGPWGVSYSSQGDLRDYAIPLLISNGKILTVYSRYGSGEVIWSGMNLPYHSLAYQNPNEADFMRRLIMGDVKPITLPTEMIRKSATSIIFKNVPEAKGIIFRERYISNLVFSWKAYDREGGLNVFMMGPGFNYIVLREGWSRGDVEMVLEDGPLRIASIAISLITVIILTLTLIRAHYRSKIRRSKHADLPLA